MSIQRRSHGSVTLYCATTAEIKHVFVAGDFNNWSPCLTPMQQIEPGLWRVTIGLTPGDHPYKFVIDGDWQCDPEADFQMDNGLGGSNSIVHVPMQGAIDPVIAVPPDTTRLSRRPWSPRATSDPPIGEISTQTLRRSLLLLNG